MFSIALVICLFLLHQYTHSMFSQILGRRISALPPCLKSVDIVCTLSNCKVIDDPAGNSYIENKLAPHADPQLNVVHYVRSEQQNKQLGAMTATKVSRCGVIC